MLELNIIKKNESRPAKNSFPQFTQKQLEALYRYQASPRTAKDEEIFCNAVDEMEVF